MKKTLKALKYIAFAVLTLIILLIVVANVAENKITHIALAQISKSIKAPVEVDNLRFTLLRRFPLATLELKGVRLGALTDSASSGSLSFTPDTLVNIDKIFISLKSRPLIKGEYEIAKVEIVGAEFNYRINRKNIGNFDFLMDTTQAEVPDTAPSAPLILDLKSLSLKNITLNYSDDTSKIKAKVFIPEMDIKAKAKNDNYSATVKGKIRLTNCSVEGTNAHLMKETTVDFNIDYGDDKVAINNVNLVTDGAKFRATGTAFMKDTISVDMQVEGSKMDLSELIKYAPVEMLKEYGVQKLTGIMDFKTSIKGVVSDSIIPHVDLTIGLEKGSVVTADYPELKNITLSGHISNGKLCNNQTTTINFKTFHFETTQSQANFAFSVSDIDHPQYNVKADMKLDLDEFKKFIADSLVRDVSGKINATFATKGQLPDSIGDDFTDYVLENSTATFDFQNFDINMDDTLKINDFSGQLVYAPHMLQINNLGIAVPLYNVTLKNTSLETRIKGKLTDTKTLDLDIKKFHLEMENFVVDISGRIKNLDHPSYNVQSMIHMDLAEMQKFMPDSMVESMSGNLTMNIKSAGTINLDSIEEQTNDLVFLHSMFNIDFENVSIKQPNDTLMQIANMFGNMTMNPQKVTVSHLKGYMGGIEFEMDSTEILNVYETFIQERKDKQLIMQTNLTFGTIDNAWIQAFMVTDTTVAAATENQLTGSGPYVTSSDSIIPIQTNKTGTTKIPDSKAKFDSLSKYRLLPNYEELGMPHFLIRGKARAKQIVYEKNILNDISLLFRFSDSLYVIDECKLKTCGGEINTSLLFDARNWNQPKVDVKNYISNLDLKQLLLANDNFGDTLLTYDKINGTLTSEFHIRAFYMDSVWPTDKIRVKGNFTIENGKIYDYAPLAELSKNIGGLKELGKMDFNTMKSSIFMFKDKIYIPKTDIVSNALDITAFAMQSMGDDYEYHIVLHLSDVLAGKSDKLMEEQAKQNRKDGSTVERNGINLVSLQLGTDKKNGFDNETLKKKFQNNLNKQEGFLNLLFYPNLVNYSTDIDRSLRDKVIMEKSGKSSE